MLCRPHLRPHSPPLRPRFLLRRDLLAEAVRGHADNWDPHSDAELVHFADDVGPHSGIDSIQGSPFACAPALGSAFEVPTLVVAGLLDATPPAAAALMRRLGPRSRLILGPWNHMMNQQARHQSLMVDTEA